MSTVIVYRNLIKKKNWLILYLELKPEEKIIVVPIMQISFMKQFQFFPGFRITLKIDISILFRLL